MGDPFVRPGLEYAPHIEQLVLKNAGTGTADTTKHEWLAMQQQDTFAAILHHPSHVAYLSVAENVSCSRMKAALLDKLPLPCDP